MLEAIAEKLKLAIIAKGKCTDPPIVIINRHDWPIIEWCEKIPDYKGKQLKVSTIIYQITLDQEKATFWIWDIYGGAYQYCDPNFPDNLIKKL